MPVVVETLPPPVQKPKRKRAPPRLRPPPPTPVVAPPPQAPPMVRYATRLNIFSGHQMPLVADTCPSALPTPRASPSVAWTRQPTRHIAEILHGCWCIQAGRSLCDQPHSPSQRHVFSDLGISDCPTLSQSQAPIDAILERMMAGKQAWE